MIKTFWINAAHSHTFVPDHQRVLCRQPPWFISRSEKLEEKSYLDTAEKAVGLNLRKNMFGLFLFLYIVDYILQITVRYFNTCIFYTLQLFLMHHPNWQISHWYSSVQT